MLSSRVAHEYLFRNHITSVFVENLCHLSGKVHHGSEISLVLQREDFLPETYTRFINNSAKHAKHISDISITVLSC